MGKFHGEYTSEYGYLVFSQSAQKNGQNLWGYVMKRQMAFSEPCKIQMVHSEPC